MSAPLIWDVEFVGLDDDGLTRYVARDPESGEMAEGRSKAEASHRLTKRLRAQVRQREKTRRAIATAVRNARWDDENGFI